MNGLSMLLPELFLALAVMVLTLVSAWRGDKGMQGLAVAGVAVLAVTGWLVVCQEVAQTGLNGMVATDAFRRFIKLIVLATSAGSLLIAPSFFGRENEARPAFVALVLFAVLGMLLLVSAQDMISLYVALELQNLALYVLVSFVRGGRKSSEAGLKYFTLGAMASAILLFGLSLLYGIAGTTSLPELGSFLAAQPSLPYGAAAGIALLLAGLAFKVSAFPFHMWTPDVYEGAPTPVTAFLATAPKASVFGLLAVLCAVCFSHGPASSFITPLFAVFAVASMALGSFTGLWQTGLKRLMAYSAILNSGTILIAFAVQDWASLLVYLSVYTVGTFGVLGGVSLLARTGRSIELTSDLAGLSKTHPLLVMLMAVSLFSLAGVPPLAGFFGKFAVLTAAASHQAVWLAVCGVLASVVGAGYYLKLIKLMFFDDLKGLPADPVSGRIPFVVVGLACAFLVLFVLHPSCLIEAASEAAGSLLAR